MRDYTYFSRVPYVTDGRAFDERTRQAVLRTASNVGTYRALVEALSRATDGSLIVIDQKIEVPETLLVKNNKITITCQGLGALVPSITVPIKDSNDHADLTCFQVQEVDKVSFLGMQILKNANGNAFNKFVEFKYSFDLPVQDWIAGVTNPIKSIFIKDCYVFSQQFISAEITGNFPKDMTRLAASPTFWYKYTGQRSFIINNVHITGSQYLGSGDELFFGDDFFMGTFLGNESSGCVFLDDGTFNMISNNFLAGDAAGNSLTVSGNANRNLIVGNGTRLPYVISATNSQSGNFAITP